jgi:unsaturated chondroitin disaccharide hydrolase
LGGVKVLRILKNRKLLKGLVGILFVSMISGCSAVPKKADTSKSNAADSKPTLKEGELPLKDIQKFILDKTKQNSEKYKDKLPNSTVGGKYTFLEDGGWVGGFWPGLNYLCYELSGDKFYLDSARASKGRFTKRLYTNGKTLDHDIGFLYSPTSVAEYKLTGDEEAKKIAIDAADMLAKRFNEKGRYIQAWNSWDAKNPDHNKDRMIIDTMYNLPLLFWAAKETGNEEYKKIAIAHADTAARLLVRSDFTTFHTYLFNWQTGEPKEGKTHQGARDDSCWARGQSWAIGGFTYVYKYTGDKKYLDLAENLAKYFISNLEPDFVPVWDFKVYSKEGQPRDTSAAAVAAASMLELTEHVGPEKKAYYIDISKKIIGSLYSKYSSKDKPGEEGLLLEATGNKPANKDINVSLIYGDYYFVEAVARLSKAIKVYW